MTVVAGSACGAVRGALSGDVRPRKSQARAMSVKAKLHAATSTSALWCRSEPNNPERERRGAVDPSRASGPGCAEGAIAGATRGGEGIGGEACGAATSGGEACGAAASGGEACGAAASGGEA